MVDERAHLRYAFRVRLFGRHGGSTSSRRMAIGIFLIAFAAVMVGGSRERPWGDARIMHDVAEAIGLRGRIDIAVEWPPQSHRGPDGKIYGQYALGPSAVQVPGIWLRQAVTAVAPHAFELTQVITSHLASACLAAGTASLFFLCAVELGVSIGFALLGALALLPTTILVVYARSPYSEALQAFASIGLFRAAWRTRFPGSIERRQEMWRHVGLGLWGGALILSKIVFAPTVMLVIGWVLWPTRQARSVAARNLAAIAAGIAPALVATLVYNAARWGAPWDTGYGDTLSLWHGTRLHTWCSGLWGLSFSSGKSFWLYSPPLILACGGAAVLRKHQPGAVGLLACIVLPSVGFYAGFLSWSGDYAWGPRYLVFATPVVALSALVWVHRFWTRRWTRWATSALLVCGFAITALGSALYWDHWIRISIAAKKDWLGDPNRAGSRPPKNALGLCDSCTEDMFAHQWLPALNPIFGHAWLVHHVARQDPWTVAERDAPWRQFTDLETPSVARPYAAARIDWWGVALADPQQRTTAWCWLVMFFACGGVGVALLSSGRGFRTVHVRDR